MLCYAEVSPLTYAIILYCPVEHKTHPSPNVINSDFHFIVIYNGVCTSVTGWSASAIKVGVAYVYQGI